MGTVCGPTCSWAMCRHPGRFSVRFGRCNRVTVGHLRAGLQTGYCGDTGGGWSRLMLAHRSQLFAVPEFIALLRKHGIGFVIADTGKKWLEYEDVTSDFVYIRLHGPKELYRSGYSAAALSRWAKRIRLWSTGREPGDARTISIDPAPSSERRDVYCYFDNTDKHHAPGDALALMRNLSARRGESR